MFDLAEGVAEVDTKMSGLKMMVPDGSVLAKALITTSARFVQAELESSIAAKPGAPTLLAKVKNLGASTTPSSTSAVNTSQGSAGSGPTGSGKGLCKYFFRAGGCRRASRCPFSHDMSHLPKAERAKRCLLCGGEEHRQKDCPTRQQRTTTKPAHQGGSSPGFAHQGQGSGDGREAAVRHAEPEGETSPSSTTPATVVSGELVWTLESLLKAAAKVAGTRPPDGPTINVISLRTQSTLQGDSQAFALVDSGATHALRRAKTQEEWSQASPVTVNLAEGESVCLRMNPASTILVPITSATSTHSSAPIVPLGALVGQLGYTMTWSSNKCKLEGRGGDAYNLRVREGCPEIAEQDALRLIARLENENLEILKKNTAVTKKRVKAAAMSMTRTWFDYLLSYVDGEMASEVLRSIEAAQFLQEVPEPCRAGLVESFPEANGWTALKGLEHLNRRTRKRLQSSDKWVVHLFAGKKEKKDLFHLEAHGYTILELDIERGRTHDLLRTATWRALEFAARKGKIAAVIGGPPQTSFMISRHVVGGPEPVSYLYGNWPGQSDPDVWLANRETQLMTRMIYLHALATAGRIRAAPGPGSPREVAFLLEHPRDPRGYLKFQDPLYGDVVSFWRTSLWTGYALEAGFHAYNFDMAAFGKAFTRHTTIRTNLPLKHLDGLRRRWHVDGPTVEASPACVWTTEFYEHVVISLGNWGTIPRSFTVSLRLHGVCSSGCYRKETCSH